MKKPGIKCFTCGKTILLTEGYFESNGLEGNKAWTFQCEDCPKKSYYIPAKEFFSSPEETIDWLAHMSEKVWFSPRAFLDMMERLRDELL